MIIFTLGTTRRFAIPEKRVALPCLSICLPGLRVRYEMAKGSIRRQYRTGRYLTFERQRRIHGSR